MTKKKKILICVICFILLCGSSTLGVFAWKNYQDEKAAMKKGKNAEITEAFHDQGGIYMTPVAPETDDKVTVRLRCARYNVTKAQVQVTSDGGTNWKSIEMAYEKPDETGYYDIWKGTIPAQSEPYFYRFAIANDATGTTMYLGTQGLKTNQLDTTEMFYVIPGFNTPEWSQGTMWYYAHIGQFYNGDTSNDLYREYLMKDNPYGNDSQSMHRSSGDIVGLREKLDYITSLGVESLAVGPFFSSSETLGFGTDNMAAVETAFGTEEQLKGLISEVHDRDMKITTDMIISYSTDYSKYYNVYGAFPTEGAYQSKSSLYYPLFRFPQWPYNGVKIWGSMGLDVADEDAAKLIYSNKDSMVLRYMNDPYGLDGYRFDAEESVGNLGYEYEPEKYFTAINKAIKEVSQDKLILAENCTGIADQYNTLFDSSWQKNGYFAMKKWLEGQATGSEMLNVLKANLINTARPRALSSYNFLGQHDVVRLWENTEAQKNDIQALLLLQMTYLGSPVVYFGDEIGMTNGEYDNQTHSGFVWDESTWNYNILNLVKTLGQARKEYSCLRTGVICHGEVDDAQTFLAFGRFDDNGSAITLCNKQGVVVEREIDVSRYNVRDGKVLTDYLTGATYKVKDGKVTVDVIPGGTLLVTGADSSLFRGSLETADLGRKIEVVKEDEKVFEVAGKGDLSGKADKIGFANQKVFNNISVSAQITENSNGKPVLMIRDDLEKDSAFYAVTIKNNEVVVLARKENGKSAKEVAKVEIPEGAFVKVARENGNLFVVYQRKSEETEWVRLDKTAYHVAMSEEAYAGITVLSGTVTFSGVTIEQNTQQICDEFDGSVLGSMFTSNGKNIKPEKGKLVLNAVEDDTVYVKTNAHAEDWTFRAQVGSLKSGKKSEKAAAGVISMTDERDYVIAGRAQIDGQNLLVLAKMVDGVWQMAGSVEDEDATAEITIQLQRIGSRYSAIASYDGKNWFTIGESIYCNYTEMYAGVAAINTEAAFEYACFGNSIEDGVTKNTPVTPGTIETGYRSVLYNIDVDKMSYLGNEDTWEDIGSGYEQKSAEGISMLYCENKLFNDVKAEATITINKGSGTAGILIGKQERDKSTDHCYQVALDQKKQLSVILNGKELASCKLKEKGDSVRVVARRENGYLHIFAGKDSKLVLSVKDDTYAEGYVAYYTDCVSASFANYDITALDCVWYTNMSVMGTDNMVEHMETNSLMALEGVGITEGVVAFQTNTKLPESKDNENLIGVILGGSFGRRSAYGGVTVGYSYKTGKLTATEADESLGEVRLAEPETMDSISLMVVYRNGKYDIYANQSQEPVLSVEAGIPNGGSVCLFSSKGTTYFYNTKVCDITGIDDVESLDIVKNWRQTSVANGISAAVMPSTGTVYEDDFSDYSGWSRNCYKIKTDGGNWYLKDGVLRADSRIKNWNIATITNGLFKNVDVQMKVRFVDYEEDNSSSISINLGKQRVYTGREDSGISFSVYGSGFVRLYDTAKKENLNGYKHYVEHVDEWFDMRIKAVNNQITIYINGNELWSGRADSLENGYLALQADYANIEIDDISVRPIS